METISITSTERGLAQALAALDEAKLYNQITEQIHVGDHETSSAVGDSDNTPDTIHSATEEAGVRPNRWVREH